MSALLNLTNASWKRQPTGRVNINPKFMGTQQIYVCPGVFLRADVSGRRVGSLSGISQFRTDSAGIGIYTPGSDGRWSTVQATGLSIPANDVKCFLAYFRYLGGITIQSYIVSQPPWGIAIKHSSFGGRCGGWQGSAYFDFGFTLPVGAIYCLLVIHKNSTLYCFLNGKLVAQVGQGTNPLGISSDIFNVNNYTGFNTVSKVTTYLAGITNADLFSAALEITANPWTLFNPEKSLFYLIPDGSGVGTNNSIFSLDSFIQKSFTQNITLDSLLQKTFNSTISLDSLISAVQSRIISLDAVLQVAGGISVSVDALLQLTKTGTLSVDALLQATLIKHLSLDALIQQSKTQIVSFDALIKAVKTGTVSLDALITGASGISVLIGLDALIQAIQNKTLSLDALIQQTYTSTLALDSYIALLGMKTVSLDSLLQMTKTEVVSFDALISVTKTYFVEFDALIQAAKTNAISLDAILTLATMASVFLDAFVQKSLDVGVSLDAMIGVIADMILPASRIIQASASDRLTVASPANRFINSLPTDRIIL